MSCAVRGSRQKTSNIRNGPHPNILFNADNADVYLRLEGENTMFLICSELFKPVEVFFNGHPNIGHTISHNQKSGDALVTIQFTSKHTTHLTLES
jgi:hypothetical protein